MRISDWSSDVCSSDLLDVVAENATRLERSPARLQQPLADASFDTWIKYYKPDENTPNTAVSYYVKGALVAQIGRAPCREGGCRYVWISVVAGSLQKKIHHESQQQQKRNDRKE